MSQASLLKQLADIQSPEAISLWPLAQGWYWLIALVIVLIIATSLSYVFYFKPRRYRRLAIKALNVIEKNYHGQDFLFHTAQLLKQTALQRHPDAAQLSGKAWQDFLSQAMTEDMAQLFAIARYQKTIHFDQTAAYQAAITWIKTHS